MDISSNNKLSISIDTSKINTDIILSKQDVDKYINTCLRDSCKIIRDYAKNHHRFKSNTGRLERAIKFRVIDRVKQGIIYIDPSDLGAKDANKPYSVFQTQGTGIYNPDRRSRIYPRNSDGWLKFYWRTKGKWCKFKSVKGIPKDDFLDKALINTELEVKYIFNEGLNQLINGYNRILT